MDMDQKTTEKKANFLETVWGQGVEIYLFLMLAVYPLFTGRGYSEMIYRKWALFLYASIVFVTISALGGLSAVAERKKQLGPRKNAWKFGDGWIITDWFVLFYMISIVISYIGAVDHKAALWGIKIWYMGLVSQLLLAGIYYGISRKYTGLKYLAVLTAIVWFIVDGIMVLQRFGVDVAHLYRKYGEETKRLFVSTQGQITWTSSYVNILLIVGMGIYYLAGKKREKILLLICISFGFGAAILLNCDSGIIAVLAAWMVMLWLALGSKQRLLALTEIVMAALAATAIVGFFERIFAEQMVPIDTVYQKVPQSWIIYVLLAIAAAFYLLLKKDKIQGDAKKQIVKILRVIYVLSICLGIIVVAVLFVLHGKGYFAGSFTENYFHFNYDWGNGRGFIWRTGVAVFGDFNLWRKLFGCGPDSFLVYAYDLMGDEMNNFWPTLTISNVHNEWFNEIITCGLVGGLAYLGIFVSAAYHLLKSGLDGNDAVMFGIGLAVVGYMAHNTLCFQQLIGTPLIFILLGIGVAKARGN